MGSLIRQIAKALTSIWTPKVHQVCTEDPKRWVTQDQWIDEQIESRFITTPYETLRRFL